MPRLLATAFAVFLMVLAVECRAQSLHAILVSDSSEWAGWGEYAPNITMDSVSMFALLANNLPPEQLELLPMSISEGGSPEAIYAAIAETSPGPDDTLLFYFTGHGGNDDQGHHLLLEGGKLYRSTLLRALEAKGARLTVLLTDCCNTRGDGLDFIAPAPSIREPKTVSPAFQSLFFEPRGTVDLNGSSPGESAFFRTRVAGDPLPRGSVFTSVLVEQIDRGRRQPLTWERVVRDVSLGVHFAFREDYPQGARSGKGATALQIDQTVYAVAYPGMPERTGPRTGLIVRDSGGSGALITSAQAGSPASEVITVAGRRMTALRPGQVIIEANGQRVTGAEQFARIVRDSPQVLRFRVVERDGTSGEYLMRLRY